MTSLRLLGAFSGWFSFLLALVLAMAAWWLYRREVRQLAIGAAGWLLPLLRAMAIFLIVLTLAEPTIETRHREGTPGKIQFLLDDSQSMSVSDRLEQAVRDADKRVAEEKMPFDDANRSGMTRLERAATHLLGPGDGVLTQLTERFELSVSRFGSERPFEANGNRDPIALWSSTFEKNETLPVSPSTWLPNNWGDHSAIGDAVAQAIQRTASPDRTASSDRTGQAANSAIVLLSDGQNNAGEPLLNGIRGRVAPQTPIYVVGYGATTEPPDIALIGWEIPQRVYRTDTLSGSLVVNQRLPANSRWKAEILYGGQVVWENETTSVEAGRSEIPFAFAVAPLFNKQLNASSRDATYAILPLPLEARLSTSTPEANSDNNRRRISVDVVSQKSTLLLVDGRSRWETRYLRNLFERDPAWHIDTVLASNALDSSADVAGNPSYPELATLPTSRDQLFDYNLVILGDTPASLWTAEQLDWLRDFVERGGGLILIDGTRNHLQDDGYQALGPLFPIRWENHTSLDNPHDLLRRTELTEVGRGLSVLEIAAREPPDGGELWSHLPKLQLISRVEPLPGSEVLLDAVSDSAKHPLLVTRRFGGGRVLFLATDETWRWRYKVGDAIHQRFWNQLARWTMRIPLGVQGEFVSLDTGASMIGRGQPVEVRCSLREVGGAPALDKTVTAIIRRSGEIVSRLPLNPVDESPGFYSNELLDLLPGDYQVQVEAAGYPLQALAVASRFTVQGAESREMDQIAQDDTLLRQLAADSGGEYLNETDVARLVDLLAPHSSGRILQSSTILWQSYWWFCTAMLLLIVEWILRKRSGLI